MAGMAYQATNTRPNTAPTCWTPPPPFPTPYSAWARQSPPTRASSRHSATRSSPTSATASSSTTYRGSSAPSSTTTTPNSSSISARVSSTQPPIPTSRPSTPTTATAGLGNQLLFEHLMWLAINHDPITIINFLCIPIQSYSNHNHFENKTKYIYIYNLFD